MEGREIARQAVLGAALASAVVASPASATSLQPASPGEASGSMFVMDAAGNLHMSGVLSDEALTRLYGALELGNDVQMADNTCCNNLGSCKCQPKPSDTLA